MADEKTKTNTPYLPYKTFINSFDYLSPVIPPRIDRTIWKQPGTVQSQILNAYKFFGLVNESQQPTEKLRAIVEHRQTPGAHVRRLLEEKYADVLKHDLSAITLPILNDAFKDEFGLDGETRRKAVRFFLQAAKAAGLTLSKFLLDQTRAPITRKRRTRTENGADNGEADAGEIDEPSAAMTKTIALVSGGELTLSATVDLFELSEEDRQFVFSLVDSLRGYEKGSAQKAAHGA